jgi:lipopolysaccharide biosynthesis glycosyltransferase
MIHLKEFIHNNQLCDEVFIIIGKGPSISLIQKNDEKGIKISLNHVVRDQVVDIAHIIDFDVFEDVGMSVYDNARYLLMPLHPHINCRPSSLSLHHLIKKNRIIKKMNEEGRLIWYKLGTKRYFLGGYPTYPAGYFSGDVIVGVLAAAGVKNIKLVGVDGGNTYADSFVDLNQKTLLVNGRESFDIQFSRIRFHIMENDLNYSHILDDYPIKVYVATTEAQMLATKVLEYSIKKYSSKPVDLIPMHECGISYHEPNRVENRQRTPFSFQRFLIPKLNNYHGKAIYLDSDMQVFADINKIWTLPMGQNDLLTVKSGKGDGRKLQFSVMLLDCSKLAWDINDIVEKLNTEELNYTSLMHGMKVAENISADIVEHWNSLEKYTEGKTCLLHYTDMETQPWVSTKNSNELVWVSELISAIEDGFISIEYVRSHIEKGWVRPSLEVQILKGISDSKNLSSDELLKDKTFSPPYNELICGYSEVSSNILMKIWVKAVKFSNNLKRRL